MVPEKKMSSATPAVPSFGREAEQRDLPLSLGQRAVLAHHLHGSRPHAPAIVKRDGVPRRDHDVTDPAFNSGPDILAEKAPGYGFTARETPDPVAEPRLPGRQQPLRAA